MPSHRLRRLDAPLIAANTMFKVQKLWDCLERMGTKLVQFFMNAKLKGQKELFRTVILSMMQLRLVKP